MVVPSLKPAAKQLARSVGIIGIKPGDGFVVGPVRLRQVHVGGLAEASERRLDEGLAVDREVEGLAHFTLSNGGLAQFREDLEDMEASGLGQPACWRAR